MKKLLLVCLLTLSPLLADAWTTFTPPDHTWEAQFPESPKQVQNGPQLFMWGVAEPGKAAYMVGYAHFPGWLTLKPAERRKIVDDFTRGIENSQHLKVSTKKKLGGGYELVGETDANLTAHVRVIPADFSERLFTVMTLGDADYKRFFRDFKAF